MFRTSRVHHQEDHLYMQFLYRMCVMHLYKQSDSLVFHLLDWLHKCMKNIPLKTACTNGLPDDEHVIFETRLRHQGLN